jgi:hypothetical protein
MRWFLYLLSFLGGLCGILAMLITVVSAGSAPQEAAGFAGSCALALGPYVMARAYDLMHNAEAVENARRSVKALETLAERQG